MPEQTDPTRRYRVLKGRHGIPVQTEDGYKNVVYGPKGSRDNEGAELPNVMTLTDRQATDKLARGMIEPIAESLKATTRRKPTRK